MAGSVPLSSQRGEQTFQPAALGPDGTRYLWQAAGDTIEICRWNQGKPVASQSVVVTYSDYHCFNVRLNGEKKKAEIFIRP
jgi:hypothetical protein